MTDNSCFVICMAGTAYVAHNFNHPTPMKDGWRPLIWTRSLERAEKFGSKEAAELFMGLALLQRGYYAKRVVMAAGPDSPDGGTPIALKMAA